MSSAVLYEGVKDILTAEAKDPSGNTTTVPAGETVSFSGTVTPDRSGHVIYLERQNASGTGFHVVDLAIVEAGTTATESKYTIPYQVFTLGTNVFRVKIPGDGLNGGAVSQTFTINVTPPTTPTPETPNNSPQLPQGQL